MTLPSGPWWPESVGGDAVLSAAACARGRLALLLDEVRAAEVAAAVESESAPALARLMEISAALLECEQRLGL